ncbi:MAG: BlaI/MecI/CopY family transcriptional regulator [Planctomycetota bacterium]
MSERQYEVGNAELEVIKVLWDLGPSTVRDVLNHLHEQGRRVAYTTVLTFLTRLEQKGHVSSDKSNVAYVYRATVSRRSLTRSRLHTLVEDLFDGAPGQLALQLMRTTKFTQTELEELQRLIEQLDTKQQQM